MSQPNIYRGWSLKLLRTELGFILRVDCKIGVHGEATDAANPLVLAGPRATNGYVDRRGRRATPLSMPRRTCWGSRRVGPRCQGGDGVRPFHSLGLENVRVEIDLVILALVVKRVYTPSCAAKSRKGSPVRLRTTARRPLARPPRMACRSRRTKLRSTYRIQRSHPPPQRQPYPPSLAEQTARVRSGRIPAGCRGQRPIACSDSEFVRLRSFPWAAIQPVVRSPNKASSLQRISPVLRSARCGLQSPIKVVCEAYARARPPRHRLVQQGSTPAPTASSAPPPGHRSLSDLPSPTPCQDLRRARSRRPSMWVKFMPVDSRPGKRYQCLR